MKKYKDRTKNLLLRVARHLKPIILFGVLMVILNATTLSSSINNVGLQAPESEWAYLDEDPKDSDDFDFKFSIKDLKGNQYPFETFRGKVIFLNMWATWCGPCRDEMRGIQKLYDRVDHDKIEFVMFSIDRQISKDKVDEYIKSKGFTFPVYMAAGTPTEELQKLRAIPTTYLISKEGKVVKKIQGRTWYNNSKYQKLLKELSQ